MTTRAEFAAAYREARKVLRLQSCLYDAMFPNPTLEALSLVYTLNPLARRAAFARISDHLSRSPRRRYSDGRYYSRVSGKPVRQ